MLLSSDSNKSNMNYLHALTHSILFRFKVGLGKDDGSKQIN